MKIVDRKTFLQMPKGTVFCKFPIRHIGDGASYPYGLKSPHILEDSFRNDFRYSELGDFWYKEADDSFENIEAFEEMLKHIGKELPFESTECRDGLYEDDNVGFAIYSREEVQEMIDQLQQALIDGYGEHKES